MVFALVKRHLQFFFRDRLGVFFSLLSPLIMILLYAFFLGTVQLEDLKDNLPGSSEQLIQNFVNSWVFAGIIMITTITTCLAALNVFVEDRASGRFKDFAVSPIKKSQLVVSYLLSTCVVSLIMSTVIFIISQIYMSATGGSILPWVNLLQAYGIVALLCLVFAAISSFIVTFIKSTGAFTSISVIVGTMAGFLAGIYIQPGTLSTGVTNFISVLPFAQADSILAKPFTEQTLEQITTNQAARDALIEHYGIGSVTVGGHSFYTTEIVILFIAIIVVFTILAALRLRQKIA